MYKETLKKYLFHELSARERNAVEQELENDPFLKEAMEGWECWAAENNAAELERLDRELRESHARFVFRHRPKRVLFWDYVRMASAGVMVIILALLADHFLPLNTGINTNALFSAYFRPLTHPDARVRGVQKPNEESAAVHAYEEEDYAAAIRYYEKLISADPAKPQYRLFLGVSLLCCRRDTEAIIVLEKIPRSGDYGDDVCWYLALACIRNHDLARAAALLQTLTESENYYRQDAKAILLKLSGKTMTEKEAFSYF